jgi:hypothetical protein
MKAGSANANLAAPSLDQRLGRRWPPSTGFLQAATCCRPVEFTAETGRCFCWQETGRLDQAMHMQSAELVN